MKKTSAFLNSLDISLPALIVSLVLGLSGWTYIFAYGAPYVYHHVWNPPAIVTVKPQIAVPNRIAQVKADPSPAQVVELTEAQANADLRPAPVTKTKVATKSKKTMPAVNPNPFDTTPFCSTGCS